MGQLATEQVNWIQQAIDHGQSRQQIAETLGVGKTTLYNVMKAHNIVARKYPKGLHASLIEQVIAYLREKPRTTRKQLEERFCLTEYQVRWVLRENNVNPRKLRKQVSELSELQTHILHLYQTGTYISYAQIARELGISRAHVAKTVGETLRGNEVV